MKELYTDRDYFDKMFASIDNNLFDIKTRLDKLNGKVAAHEKVINENLPHNIAHCPQADTIEKLEKNMVSEHAVKKTIYIGIGILATIITIMWGVAELFL